GTMDLTEERDVVEDARLDESGTHVVSFVVDGQIVGEIECPVFLQEAPAKLPKDVEDGLRRSDVIFVEVETDGRRVSAPTWFAYRNGRIYVLSQREPGPQEQTVPGIRGPRDHPPQGNRPRDPRARYGARGILRHGARAGGPRVGGGGQDPGRS